MELARASIDLRLSHENFSNLVDLVVGVGDCGKKGSLNVEVLLQHLTVL